MNTKEERRVDIEDKGDTIVVTDGEGEWTAIMRNGGKVISFEDHPPVHIQDACLEYKKACAVVLTGILNSCPDPP